MNDKKQIIDTSTWIRKVPFEWFNSFINPTYSFNVKIDVSNIVSYSKETNTSFFANFLYVVTRSINDVEALRLRLEDENVVLYDRIDPDFTVKTEDGTFNNAGFTYTKDYKEFYKRCRETINNNNKTANTLKDYNSSSKYNLFYSSCLTSIDIESMTHPIKAEDKESTAVPRIFWSKYILDNDKYYLMLNITVSHALVDGEDLALVFKKIKEYSLNFKEIIK